MRLQEGGRIDGHDVGNPGYQLVDSFPAKKDLLSFCREETSDCGIANFLVPGRKEHTWVGLVRLTWLCVSGLRFYKPPNSLRALNDVCRHFPTKPSGDTLKALYFCVTESMF